MGKGLLFKTVVTKFFFNLNVGIYKQVEGLHFDKI